MVSKKPEMDDEVGDDVTVETVDESEINGAGNSILAKMMVVKLHAIVWVRTLFIRTKYAQIWPYFKDIVVNLLVAISFPASNKIYTFL